MLKSLYSAIIRNNYKHKFANYCKMYSEFFEDKENDFKENDYVDIYKKIVKKYEGMGEVEKQYKEIIFNDKILKYNESDVNYAPFYTGLLAFIGVLTGAFVKSFIDTKSAPDLNMILFFLLIFVGVNIYFLKIESDYFTNTIIKKGFYQMCISLLSMVNEGKFKDIDKDAEKENDNQKNETKEEVAVEKISAENKNCQFKQKNIKHIHNEEIDTKVSVRNHVSYGDRLYKCQQAGEKIVQILTDENGVPIKLNNFHTKDKRGNVVDEFSIGLSIDKQKILQKTSQSIVLTIKEIRTTTEKLTDISTQLTQSLKALNNYGGNAITDINKTSNMLQAIKDIATNSNLIGLNASIEAARAGETGKGFSVVANEIQKMGNDSAKSANDINIILKSIETNVLNMINTLTDVVKVGEEQASATKEISASMEELTSSAMEVKRMSEEDI